MGKVSRGRLKGAAFFTGRHGALLFVLLATIATRNAKAQVNVLTAHNDNARTGQNLNETTLTPSNVNPTQFGKLFSVRAVGNITAQPLYVSQVAIPGKGTHNVIYTVTADDLVSAFDADNNGGINAQPLWSKSLLTGSLQLEWGITGTPVIDPSTNTLYLVSSEIQGTAQQFRLHAIDITTGAEKFGGPIQIQGSVPGTGNGSVGGVLTFDPNYGYQRPGLLFMNGVVYLAIGSVADNGPYHGWIFSYSASTLKQIDAYCTAPNGSGDGIWMAGAGLAGEVYSPSKPYGRLFYVTGNGSFQASRPYSNSMSYGMSVVGLDLTGGAMTVTDEFTPYNELVLNGQDGDVGSGGIVLLPAQSLPSGGTLNPLVQLGKSGAFYILDRNNLGGFNSSADQIVQEVQTPQSGYQNWGAGVWGTTAYWNGSIYSGGTNPGVSNPLTAYSFVNGKLSTSPTSQSTIEFGAPSPSPSVSANGTQNGIVWAIDTNGVYTGSQAVLTAFDATNLASLLYSSNSNLARDNPGLAIKFTVPTIANGKVYVPAISTISVYGLLGVTPTVSSPVFNPPSSTFTGSQSVSISDATSGAQIFYTTDGSTPTVNSHLYTGPIAVTSSETVKAIASATGYLQGPSSSATYTSTANTATPVLSLSPGTYQGKQTLSITDGSTGAKIYYTVDGTKPTTSSNLYVSPISVPVSEVVQVMATSPGLLQSALVSASYTIAPVYAIDFTQGFANALSSGQMQFNGSTDLDDIRLQLTNGGNFEAGSGFYKTPVNIRSFTTDFVFQISNPLADGMTFTIQNSGPNALGGMGGSLGYAGISKSVAIKFDIHNNSGEGPNSTGLYIDGVAPTVPAVNLTGTGIDLHGGDQFDAHITYDGTDLTMTLTNVVSLATWSQSFPVNIPAVVGGNTAFVGFTGGSGSQSASQKVTYWTYTAGTPSVPNYPTGFDSAGLILNGATLSGTSLQLTDGGALEARSAYYSQPIDVQSFSTSFNFQMSDATADGFTFVIQNQSPNAVGTLGEGLGYATIPKSVAIKFSIYNDGAAGNFTGAYVNGASPGSTSINLSASRLQLGNGDPINVQINYDGKMLTWSILDLVVYIPAHESAKEGISINIPNMIGSNTAYVGFTGGTGSKTAVQDILNWTFSNP